MKQHLFGTLADAIRRNLWYYILSAFAVCLLSVSLVLPPRGIIDPSVLAAVGEICGIMSIGTVLKAMDMNKEATYTKGDVSVVIGKEKTTDVIL